MGYAFDLSFVREQLETDFYESLKSGGLIEKLKKYEHQPVEELATLLSEDFQGIFAGILKLLDDRGKVPGYSEMCRAAFETAIQRLIIESRESDVEL